MTYTNNTPQSNQKISQTTTPIRNNFMYIDTSMKVDHTFNGNGISTEASGSHQKLSFPNQPVDISSLPSGVAAVQYAIGGNLFSYNGQKQPISGVSATGTIALTAVPQVVAILPNDCVGVIMMELPLPVNSVTTLGFFSVGGNVFFNIGQNGITLTGAPNNLLVSTSSAPYTATYKYIYWPI